MNISHTIRISLVAGILVFTTIVKSNQPPSQAQLDQTIALVPQVGHSDFFLYDGISEVAISPTNTTIATGGGDGSIKFFDITSSLLIRSLTAHLNGVGAIAYSPDGKQLASGGGDGKVRLWDVDSGMLITTFEGHKTPVNCVAFSFDGNTLASGSGSYGDVGSASDNTVRLWNIRTKQPAGVLNGHQASVEDIAFNGEGTLLVSGSLDKTIKIWALNNNNALRTIQTEATSSVTFSPDGSTIASAVSQRVVFWSVGTGAQIRQITHAHYTGSIRFTSDWRLMAVRNELWNPYTGVKVKSFQGRQNNFFLAISADGTLLASRDNNTLVLWDTQRAVPLFQFHQPPGLTTGLAFSRAGDKLAWGRKNQVYIWNLRNNSLERIINAHKFDVNEVAFSPDGQQIASCSDGELKIWSVSDGRSLQDLSDSSETIGDFQTLQFSPNGKLLAVGGAVGDDQAAVGIWNPSTGKLLKTITIPTNSPSAPIRKRSRAHALAMPGGPSVVVHSVAFSPDGKLLVSGDENGNVILWNVKTGRRVRMMKEHDSTVNSVAFNHKGTRIASGSFDQTVKIWEVSSGRALRTLKPHQDHVTSVRFSPDDQTIMSGSLDRGVRFWNVTDGKQLALLEDHESAVTFVGFNPGGKIAASSSLDGRIDLWSTSTRTLISTIFAFDDTSWINFSPDGFYAGSPKALDHIAWRVGNKIYPSAAFASERSNPQILLARLSGAVPPPVQKPATFSPIAEFGEVIPFTEFEKKMMNDWKDHHYYALVIGNNKYLNLKPLNTAVNDATELAQLLEQRFGFTVTLLKDAKREQIINELEKQENLPKNSSLLIFYAGHGQYIDFGAQKEGVWQPVDAEDNNRSKWIRSAEILESVRLNSSLHTLIISDSCFSGTLLNRGSGNPVFNERPEVLLDLMKRPSWTLVASGGNEPVEDFGQDGHSVFARALLNGLRSIPQNIFTVDYLFHHFIHDQVQERARQDPKIRPIPGFEDDGKFIFVRRRR
jgi:WD40 repeat protein